MTTQTMTRTYRPRMTRAGLSPTHDVVAIDEFGGKRDMSIAGESPLTIKVDGQEVVTLMTLGTHPEELALGYLRNQRLVEKIEDIESVTVDWEREQVNIATHRGEGIVDWEEKMANRTVTTGCGQGTIFSCTLGALYQVELPQVRIRQSMIYAMLKALAEYNELYKKAGAVHGCALCAGDEVLMFVEDVGRHNAADAIAGRMWLDGIDGGDKVFYTTGRLTSEIVMKTALMGIPVLLSRSGITNMGLELAEETGVIMIARAKGRHFLIYHGADRVDLDAMPPPKETAYNRRPPSEART
ncbi:MAG: formate dehydrogenase accessory sulfurtransferase FdhD [Gammaproteobacteria bacterium]|nr:formate dehydrogenase accessory sulfurtransferase FdhD [Gammaproteobacteria bacterium]